MCSSHQPFWKAQDALPNHVANLSKKQELSNLNLCFLSGFCNFRRISLVKCGSCTRAKLPDDLICFSKTEMFSGSELLWAGTDVSSAIHRGHLIQHQHWAHCGVLQCTTLSLFCVCLGGFFQNYCLRSNKNSPEEERRVLWEPERSHPIR